MGQSSSRQNGPASSQRTRRPHSSIIDPRSEASHPFQERRRRSAVLPSFTTRTEQRPIGNQDAAERRSERRRSRFLRPPASLRDSFRTILGRNESSTGRGSLNRREDILPSSTHDPAALTSPTGASPPQLDMPIADEPLDIPPLRRARPLSEVIPRSTHTDTQSRPDIGASDNADRQIGTTRPRPMSLPPQPLGPSFSRRSLRRGGDPDDFLSRVLHQAAQATAMTMRGRREASDPVSSGSSTSNIEGDEGSFNGFLQSLRNGRLAQQLSQEGSAPAGASNIEYLRLFRFEGESDNHTQALPPSTTLGSQASERQGESQTPSEDPSSRLVPVLIVGVRALDGEWTAGRTVGTRSFFDDFTSNAVDMRDEGAPNDTLGHRHESMSAPNLARRRSSSVGRFNFVSRARDARRHQELSRPATSQALSSESPPGPYPPPTTPASPSASALSSGTNTPSRRASISTLGEVAGTRSRRSSFYRRLTGGTLEPTLEEQQPDDGATPSEVTSRPRGLRRRPPINSRGSDIRHDSRRDGVLMEPSNETPTERSSTRSWIIYILGGNYPENHPLLATPSLFTDNPTYEDMLLLSNLLGPGKPPVAKADDIACAGGVYNLRTVDGILRAQPRDGGVQLTLATDEQCQVCLCGYVDGEEARELVACKHLFHRECIDEWLTTGRNSCPLCRTQGVEEHGDSDHESAQPAPAAA